MIHYKLSHDKNIFSSFALNLQYLDFIFLYLGFIILYINNSH